MQAAVEETDGALCSCYLYIIIQCAQQLCYAYTSSAHNEWPNVLWT